MCRSNNCIGTTSLKIQYCKFLPSATVFVERLCFHRCPSTGGVYTPHQAEGKHPRPGRHPSPELATAADGTVMHSCFFRDVVPIRLVHTVVKSAHGTLAKIGLTGQIFRFVTKIKNPSPYIGKSSACGVQ